MMSHSMSSKILQRRAFRRFSYHLSCQALKYDVMAPSVKQTRSIQIWRKNVIPDPRCGTVCEAVMSPFYPAVKSNLRPVSQAGQKVIDRWLGIDLSGLPPALPLLAANGPTARFTPLVGTDTTFAPGAGTHGLTTRNRGLHRFGLLRGPHRSPAKRVRWGEEGQGSAAGNA